MYRDFKNSLQNDEYVKLWINFNQPLTSIYPGYPYVVWSTFLFLASTSVLNISFFLKFYFIEYIYTYMYLHKYIIVPENWTFGQYTPPPLQKHENKRNNIFRLFEVLAKKDSKLLQCAQCIFDKFIFVRREITGNCGRWKTQVK